MTKFFIFFALILMLSGCDNGYQEGYNKGFKEGAAQKDKELENNIATVAGLIAKSNKIAMSNQQTEEELKQKEEEVELISSLWKSVAYPDLVLTRGLINVPIFSVWLIPFLAWILGLALTIFWYAKKSKYKIKPTPEELQIIEAAKEAKTTIQELQQSQKRLEKEIYEIQKFKTKANQEVNSARDELAKIKNGINQRKNEIERLNEKIKALKKEIEDLTI